MARGARQPQAQICPRTTTPRSAQAASNLSDVDALAHGDSSE